jgi:hypothetical protein
MIDGRYHVLEAMQPSRCLALLFAVATAGQPVIAQQPSTPSSSSAGTQAPPRLDAIIEEPNIDIFVPAPRCSVPAVAARVLQSVGIPAGIEYAAESCGDTPSLAADAERVTLTGLSVREALSRLVSIDPRYHWNETNGIIALRPLKAWNDRAHFLHRIAPSLRIDAENLAVALHVIQAALGAPSIAKPEQFGRQTPQGTVPIAVHLGTAASAYEALNAVVRAHGSMRWRVTYCGEQARHEFATMWMETYDGSGLGSHPAMLKDGNGKSYSPCGSSP